MRGNLDWIRLRITSAWALPFCTSVHEGIGLIIEVAHRLVPSPVLGLGFAFRPVARADAT